MRRVSIRLASRLGVLVVLTCSSQGVEAAKEHSAARASGAATAAAGDWHGRLQALCESKPMGCASRPAVY